MRRHLFRIHWATSRTVRSSSRKASETSDTKSKSVVSKRRPSTRDPLSSSKGWKSFSNHSGYADPTPLGMFRATPLRVGDYAELAVAVTDARAKGPGRLDVGSLAPARAENEEGASHAMFCAALGSRAHENVTTPPNRERPSGSSKAEPPEAASEPAEASLLAQLRAGRDEAFRELLKIHGGRLLAVARRLMRNEEDARECLQDAYLSAFRGIDRFEGNAKLGTWLLRIVVNACLMRLRSRGRKPEEPLDPQLP